MLGYPRESTNNEAPASRRRGPWHCLGGINNMAWFRRSKTETQTAG